MDIPKRIAPLRQHHPVCTYTLLATTPCARPACQVLALKAQSPVIVITVSLHQLVSEFFSFFC